MRIKLIAVLAVWMGLFSVALATDLSLTVEAVGCLSSEITIGALCETPYRVVGELSDADSDGLAMVVFDLEFDGGSLSQVDVPTELPMASFAPPAGLGNPAGFGGTPVGGMLVQVGGSQNVFGHGQWPCESDDDCPASATCTDLICSALPGLPLGTVVLGTAQPGAPATLATGTLITPSAAGTYTLELTHPVANVIEKGVEGRPYWWNDAAGIGAITGLTVTVVPGAACCDVYEACCFSDDACAMAPPEDCELMNGLPQGPDVVCERDADGDGSDGLCGDECPADPNKTEAGFCGCGVPETDSDGDTVPDCVDQCPDEDDLIDNNQNGVPDCAEGSGVPASSSVGLLLLALTLVLSASWFYRRQRREPR